MEFLQGQNIGTGLRTPKHRRRLRQSALCGTTSINAPLATMTTRLSADGIPVDKRDDYATRLRRLKISALSDPEPQ